MPVLFGNPWGALALLALPLLVAIWFLRKRRQSRVVTTLFLVAEPERISRTGAVWTRFRQSAAFWALLAALLLAAWFLSEPRWRRSQAVLPVAVVLDDTWSLQAGLSATKDALRGKLRGMASSGVTPTWIILTTDSNRGALYRGPDTELALRSLDAWEPRKNSHDFRPSLAAARSAAGVNGVVLFVTDEAKAPEGSGLADVFSVSKAEPNAAWLGGRVEKTAAGWKWSAWVRNFSDGPLALSCRVSQGNVQGSEEKIEIPAGALRQMSGPWPEEWNQARLVLTGDSFAGDNQLPLQRPLPKVLRNGLTGRFTTLSGPFLAEWERLALSPADSLRASGEADSDLLLRTGEPDPSSPVPSFSFAESGTPVTSTQVVVETHELTSDLALGGLQPRLIGNFVKKPGDQVLAWLGEKPLLILRPAAEASGAAPGFGGPGHLLANFPPNESNFTRLPGAIVLFHRFAERARQHKRVAWMDNFETNERIFLPVPGNITVTRSELSGATASAQVDSRVFRTPDEPGFFSVSGLFPGETKPRVILEGSTQRSDARESDFSRRAPADSLAQRERQLRLEASEEDHLAPLWIILALTLQLAAWGWLRRETAP